MPPPYLLHQLITHCAQRSPAREALRLNFDALDYASLAGRVEAFAHGLVGLGVERGERVALYLDKRLETVVAAFGAAACGAVMVPINPLLKPAQVGHILRDCNVRVLLTTTGRLAALDDELPRCHDLGHVVLADGLPERLGRLGTHAFIDLLQAERRTLHCVIDRDLAAILYTSGSTGQPKGVMLSHHNLVAGAHSVATYLENTAEDTLLAALPLSFDAGFSQLTTAFSVGARVVLLNYLLPRDVLGVMEQHAITGLTAVPPMWGQLAQVDWPARAHQHLRYIATTGGRMPKAVLRALRAKLPHAKPYLMYGLTEAFRSTYLPPEEADARPDSIGKAIPNVEILVLRADGSPAAPHEPGELVHRGSLVAQGYWNDPEKTAERFRPLPRRAGQVIDEIAVFSGDMVRLDDDGFVYFIGRRDEMIKTSGYRVSPTEIEEVLYREAGVQEVAIFPVPHPSLGEAIVGMVVTTPCHDISEHALIRACREHLPAYMVPQRLMFSLEALPRNHNNKIDRSALGREFRHLFQAESA